MEKYVLIVGCDKKRFIDLQLEYAYYKEFVYELADMTQISTELIKKNKYLLIIIFWQSSEDVFLLKNIRAITNIPIIVVVEKYSGSEKVTIIEAGADEYLPWPKNMWEVWASCHALIRRYTVLNQQSNRPTNIMLWEDVFLDGEYRSVVVQGKHLQLTRLEFELFYLLASYPERVFTYDQLSIQIWDTDREFTENSVHSCVRRIRRKLESIPECSYSIENVRGVGYCFRHNNL